jgi:hypothetical protein
MCSREPPNVSKNAVMPKDPTIPHAFALWSLHAPRSLVTMSYEGAYLLYPLDMSL